MKLRIAVAMYAALALALAAFTGSALGGNGHGNSAGNGNAYGQQNAPGQQQTSPGQPQSTQSTAPKSTGAKSNKTSKSSTAKSSTAKSSTAKSSTHGSAQHTSSAGVKPSNTTKHDTYAPASSNQTKLYGNGKTAGQIATQAGYGSATLHGPGNSQPHKVLCGGHEVDVHALAHKGSKCGSTDQQHQTVEQHTQTTSNCTTQTQTSEVVVGVQHSTGPKGSGRFVVIHPSSHSAHYRNKHPDTLVTSTVTTSTTRPSSACGTSNNSTSSSSTQSTSSVQSQATQQVSAQATAQQAPAGATGAVLGAVHTLPQAKAKSSSRPVGGVLGATARLGRSVGAKTLPFTGLPLWLFALVAIGLIGVGLATQRMTARR
jgi:hypothetical protein